LGAVARSRGFNSDRGAAVPLVPTCKAMRTQLSTLISHRTVRGLCGGHRLDARRASRAAMQQPGQRHCIPAAAAVHLPGSFQATVAQLERSGAGSRSMCSIRRPT
jgi:hypothetical protein